MIEITASYELVAPFSKSSVSTEYYRNSREAPKVSEVYTLKGVDESNDSQSH
jgi:hypothetical protein